MTHSYTEQPAEVDMSMITPSSRFPSLLPLTPSFHARTIVQWNSLPLDVFTFSTYPAQFRINVSKITHQLVIQVLFLLLLLLLFIIIFFFC